MTWSNARDDIARGAKLNAAAALARTVSELWDAGSRELHERTINPCQTRWLPVASNKSANCPGRRVGRRHLSTTTTTATTTAMLVAILVKY